MTVFDLTGAILRATPGSKQLLIAAQGRDILSAVATFHLQRGARRARRLSKEVDA